MNVGQIRTFLGQQEVLDAVKQSAEIVDIKEKILQGVSGEKWDEEISYTTFILAVTLVQRIFSACGIDLMEKFDEIEFSDRKTKNKLSLVA